jgi:hypothetical protein
MRGMLGLVCEREIKTLRGKAREALKPSIEILRRETLGLPVKKAVKNL